MFYDKKLDLVGRSYIETSLFGYNLIREPLLNKGMGFTEEERSQFHLHGLIPCHNATLEEQIQRSYEAFQHKASDIQKYIYLRD